MTATDVDELEELEQARRERDDDAGEKLLEVPITAPAYLKVCDRLTPEGEVCGRTISSADYADADNPVASASAAWARHVRIDHPKDETTRQKAANKSKAKRDKAPPRAQRDDEPAGEQAPPTPPPLSRTSRGDAYAHAIASYAFMAWLVPGTPIDDFDLAVINAGAPMLGQGLGGIADRQRIVRQVLDVILGEGGGPYGLTLTAALAIAAPIMAHHGHLSPEVGRRFGTVIGILEVPPPPTRPAPSEGAPTAPDAGPVAPVDEERLGDDAFGEAPVDPRNAEPDAWPSDLPATPSAAFTPLGADEPTFARDGVRDDAHTAPAFA